MSKGKAKWPEQIVVSGKPYQVLYVRKMSDCDENGRKAYWGLCNYDKAELSVYVGDKTHSRHTPEHVFQGLLHEVIHAVVEANRLLEHSRLTNDNAVDALAIGIADTFVRNGLVVISTSTPEGQVRP